MLEVESIGHRGCTATGSGGDATCHAAVCQRILAGSTERYPKICCVLQTCSVCTIWPRSTATGWGIGYSLTWFSYAETFWLSLLHAPAVVLWMG